MSGEQIFGHFVVIDSKSASSAKYKPDVNVFCIRFWHVQKLFKNVSIFYVLAGIGV